MNEYKRFKAIRIFKYVYFDFSDILSFNLGRRLGKQDNWVSVGDDPENRRYGKVSDSSERRS